MATRQIEKWVQKLTCDGTNLQLKINDNRQTMLSVKWGSNLTKVSLHRMFLKAPKNVMQAVIAYIKREEKNLSKDAKVFIEERRAALDYSHLVDPERLVVDGDVYDVQKIYERLNKRYFKNRLNLQITWFGCHNQKNSSRCSLGLYYDSLKLIKIHRLLDNSQVPGYVIDFVVYHEMVHAVCPAYIDEKGVHRVHGDEFKELEEDFRFYKAATEWMKKYQMNFFLFTGSKKNGRT